MLNCNKIFNRFLVIFWIPPLLMRYNPDCKLLSAMISLVIPYTLMSVGYESIFIFLFSQHMLNWVFIESDAKYANKVILLRCRREFKKYSDENSVRRCFYCVSFLIYSKSFVLIKFLNHY